VRGVGLGSAGSVLRSQGTLGQARHSRYRARGILVSTFLCSLRPDSAAALCYGESRGLALGGLGFWRFLGLVRGVGLGSAESVLRSQGTLGQARHSRYRAGGFWCRRSCARCDPIPLPWAPICRCEFFGTVERAENRQWWG
jgi:hypothetical protein